MNALLHNALCVCPLVSSGYVSDRYAFSANDPLRLRLSRILGPIRKTRNSRIVVQ